MQLDTTHVALVVSVAGKVLLDLADSMPPPPADCGYWRRWAYDFIQRVAANSGKVGGSR